MASAKRCHYEVMGISLDSTADEIRSAYRKLALQRHPDKLVQSGLPPSDATAQFQELQHAYEVLSDPKERAWYDSHRSEILFSDPNSVNSGSNSVVPDLFAFFSTTVYSGYSDSKKGFYRVYSDVFDKIYACELSFAKKLGLVLDSVRVAPTMGNLESPYAQATAFYSYWLGFCTVLDFCWVDQYDVMAGPNRKSRRVMEDENKKLRKKAKREYNDTVRGLAEYVKKRDKRVIDMAAKLNLETEKKRKEEKDRKEMEKRERMERAMAYEEPDWAKVEEEELDNLGFEEEENKNGGKEFYCMLCGKKFKSDKQWKNHEQSKKHREKVEEMKKSLDIEDELGEVSEESMVEVEENKEFAEDEVSGLGDRLMKDFGIEDDDAKNLAVPNDENEFDGEHDVSRMESVVEAIGSDDEDGESGVLETMVAGPKIKRNVTLSQQPKVSSKPIIVQNDSDDDTGFMEYDNRKGRRRKNRRAKKEKGNRNGVKEMEDDELRDNEEANGNFNSHMEEGSSYSEEINENNNKGNDDFLSKRKNSSKATDNQSKTKNPMLTTSKLSSKGKDSKGKSKNASNMCDTCGEDFESRNKLHRHLGETGHASLKYR